MWRPENWGDRWQQSVDTNIQYIRQGNCAGIMFEAGADAMLNSIIQLLRQREVTGYFQNAYRRLADELQGIGMGSRY